MNCHLSSVRISKYVSGDATPQEAAHVRTCERCGSESARVESSLALFRASVRNWSEHTARLEYAPAWRNPARDVWGAYACQKKSWAMSLALQTAALAVLFTFASNGTVRQAAKHIIEIYTPIDIAQYKLKAQMQGGGGGGDRSPLPASRGRVPKASLRQFTPPMVVPNNEAPKLAIDPSILAPPDVPLPQVAASNYGDPLATVGALSNGTGSGAGIGSGAGGGVGVGKGGGVGGGSYGGFGGGAFRIGGGVSAPVLIYKIEPEYSEEARKAKYQGVVILNVIIDSTGHAVDARVVRSLGLGLDEKAIEAVKQWRFKPGYKDGKPVAVLGQIEVNFRLL